MGLFDFFRKKGSVEPRVITSPPREPVPDPITMEIVDTPEKFRPMAEELVPPLVELLRSLSVLEGGTCGRSQALKRAREARGEQYVSQEEKDIWKQYKEAYGSLLEGCCTQALLDRGYAGSFGTPTAYGYLNTGCRLTFTMKSPTRAMVETASSIGKAWDLCHQFLLRSTEEGWKIDRVSYGYGGEPGKWHIFHI